MSDIPSFPYRDLWEERQILSVANLTRDDGHEFLRLAPTIPVRTEVLTLSGASTTSSRPNIAWVNVHQRTHPEPTAQEVTPVTSSPTIAIASHRFTCRPVSRVGPRMRARYAAGDAGRGRLPRFDQWDSTRRP